MHLFRQQRECIVALGDTGLGKSSLLRLFCGDIVEVGHDANSCTSEPQIFVDQQDDNRFWMDTMGSNDSNRALSDREIRRKIMFDIQRNEITRVKIIWFVEKSSRATTTLKEQAEFIASFGDYTDGNVWCSVLICVKENTLNPRDRVIQGVLAAADAYEATGITMHTIGYTLLECLDDEEREEMFEMPDKRRRKKGYLMNDEVKTEVLKCLGQVSVISIHFDSETCKKCGVTADPRCMPARCHTSSMFVHRSSDQVHPGRITDEIIRFCPLSHRIQNGEWKALSGWVYKCDGCSISYESVYYCSTCRKQYCSETSSMDWKYKALFGVGSVVTGACALLVAPEVVAAYAASEAMVAVAGGAYVGIAGVGSAVSGYEATHREVRSKCCRLGAGYSCCLGLNTAPPCAMACCQDAPGSKGCEKVCRACKGIWGDGRVFGCNENEPHEF